MMKLLFVDTAGLPGAPIDRVARLLNGLARNGFSVCLFCAAPELYREKLDPGISIHTSDWSGFAFIRSDSSPLLHRSSLGWTQSKRMLRYGQKVLPAFEEFLLLEKPDLVHLLDLDLSLNPFAEFCKNHAIPYVVHVSQIDDAEEKAGEHLPGARRVIACSESVKKWLMERFSEAYFRNYEIVPWPVEMNERRARHDLDVRDAYKTPPDAKVMVVPGPVEESRGQIDVLCAFSLIRFDFPIVYLWVVGDLDQAQGANLPQEALSLDISEKIRFLGEPGDLREILAACDLFVYVPRNGHPDSGPVDAVAEAVPWAMAAGLPVIVSDAGGAPDYILGTRAGAVVPPSSPEALAAMMRTYLSNDALLSQAGQAAFNRAGNGFSTEAVAARLGSLYRQILAP